MAPTQPPNPMDLQKLAREVAEQLQDCYEHHKAGVNFDFEAGEKLVLTALETATGEGEIEKQLEQFGWPERLRDEIKTLKLDLEQARKDGERLDWLEQRGFGISCGQSPARTDFCYQLHDYQFTRKGEWHESVRAAIDTARQAEVKEI